jgi:hypothetical protein
MDVEKVSSIWGDMEPSEAGAVMEDVEVATASQIVGLVSAERLVARLPEMSPQKLWQMPPEMLHDRMPGVNAMHLWPGPGHRSPKTCQRLSRPTPPTTGPSTSCPRLGATNGPW